MATTPHLGITLVEQAQAQKEVTVNEAIMKLDTLLNTAAKDRDLATPPASPAAGDVYIVAASPTGAWAGHAGQIAYFDQVWRFILPAEGATLWVADEDTYVTYNGSSWGTVAKFGVNSAADTTNRLSVSSPAVLFNRETNNIQVKLNKQAAGDTASFLFQTNFSGRAEIGCIGDDDFQFKVSPDGSSFATAMRIDKTNAFTTLKELRVDGIASGFSGSEYSIKQAGVQTTDATATVIASIALAQGEMVTVDALVNGFRSDYTEAFGGQKIASFRRPTGGNVTQIGATSTPHTVEDSAGTPGFTITANTTSQTVEIKVTGEAAKTFNWVATYHGMKTLTNS